MRQQQLNETKHVFSVPNIKRYNQKEKLDHTRNFRLIRSEKLKSLVNYYNKNSRISRKFWNLYSYKYSRTQFTTCTEDFITSRDYPANEIRAKNNYVINCNRKCSIQGCFLRSCGKTMRFKMSCLSCVLGKNPKLNNLNKFLHTHYQFSSFYCTITYILATSEMLSNLSYR